MSAQAGADRTSVISEPANVPAPASIHEPATDEPGTAKTADPPAVQPSDVLNAGWTRSTGVPDLANVTSTERLQVCADSPWAKLVIPEDLGGLGGSLHDAASAQRSIARIDPSVAVALNMHAFTIGLMVEYWKRHHDSSWMLLEGIANTGGLIASAFAEPGGSPNFLATSSQADPVEGGWSISGRKMPCSLATSARLYCLTAAETGTENTIVALCPAESPGITVEEPWPSVGMHASDTRAVRFDSVFIDRRLVFHSAPRSQTDDIVIAGVVWFNVLIAATYHGVLSNLVALAAERPQPAGALRRGGWADTVVGRAAAELWTLGAAAQGLAHQWHSDAVRGDAAFAAALALRAQSAETRDRVVGGLTPVLGSQIFVANTLASQLALDSLAVHHHPPARAVCDLELGRHMRGEPVDLEGS